VKEVSIEHQLLSNSFTNKHIPRETIAQNSGTVFSVLSVPGCCKQDIN
jgi:hypothetical protein